MAGSGTQRPHHPFQRWIPSVSGIFIASVLSVFVCLQLVDSASRPGQFATHLNIHQLQHPAETSHFIDSDGRNRTISKQSFHHFLSNGEHVKLTYEVVHHPHNVLLQLDSLSSVLEVTCLYDSSLILLVRAGGDFKFETLSPGWLISGSRSWNCSFDADKPSSVAIFRRIINSTKLTISPTIQQFTIFTEPAQLVHAFEHAKATFSSSAFSAIPRDNEVSSQEVNYRARNLKTILRVGSDDSTTTGSASGGWFDDFFDFVCSTVKTIADDVSTVVNAAANIVVAAFSGDLSGSSNFPIASLNWNFNANSVNKVQQPNILFDEHASCDECFIELDASVVLEITIASYSLNHMSVYIKGNANALLSSTMASQGSFQMSNDFILTTVSFQPIDFAIAGIPFVLETVIPVHGGYSISVNEAAKFSASVSAQGTIQYGFQYTQQNGFQFINSHSWNYAGSVSQVAARLNADLIVYTMPVFIITLDRLGSVSVGVKAYIEPSIQFDGTESPCSPDESGAGTLFKLDWGMQLTIGANVSISVLGYQVFDKQFGPYTYTPFSMKWPLVYGCIVQSSSLSLSNFAPDHRFANASVMPIANSPDFMLLQPQQDIIYEGMSFSGLVAFDRQNPNCQFVSTLSVPVFFQLTKLAEATTGLAQWVASGNHNFVVDAFGPNPFNVACISQVSFLASGGVFRLFEPTGINPTFKKCVLDAQGYVMLNLGGAYSLSADYRTLTINTGNACLQNITLSRRPDQMYTSW